MKKIYSIVLIIVMIIICSSITAFAANSVSFELSGADAAPNRLVTLELKAKSSQKFCAALFEFSYDTKMLEFRSVKVSDSSSKIKANDLDGKVKVSFLNSDGLSIPKMNTIFTITFKTSVQGSTFVDYKVSDCVDGNVNSLDIGKCSSSEITVSKAHNNNTDKNSKSESKSKDDNKSSGNSKRNSKESSSSPASIDEWGELNPINDKSTLFLIIGLVGGASLVILVVLAFLIGRRSFENKIKKQSDDTDNLHGKQKDR